MWHNLRNIVNCESAILNVYPVGAHSHFNICKPNEYHFKKQIYRNKNNKEKIKLKPTEHENRIENDTVVCIWLLKNFTVTLLHNENDFHMQSNSNNQKNCETNMLHMFSIKCAVSDISIRIKVHFLFFENEKLDSKWIDVNFCHAEKRSV